MISSAVSTIYLGKSDRKRKGVIKAQEQFSITDQSTTVGTLLNGTNFKILLDSGTTKSFMSEQYKLRNKYLHGLTKFSLKAKGIQVENGKSVNILFIIPIIIATQVICLRFILWFLRYMIM